MSLLINMLSRLVITFLPRSQCLLISWLQSPSTGILESKKKCHCFYFFPFYLPWSDGIRCHDLSFFNAEFQASFSLSSFTLIKRLFSSSLFSAIRMVFSAYLRCCKKRQNSYAPGSGLRFLSLCLSGYSGLSLHWLLNFFFPWLLINRKKASQLVNN